MPVKYSVKRNALSSKWGVWAIDPDSKSPVENLLAEFKKGEDAESYQARVEAGEMHADIIASLSAKKPKAAGNGGVMGKLFNRGSREQLPVDATEPTVHNPVIEIPAPSKRVDEVETPEVEEIPVAAKPTRTIEAPSRFQIIEQPPAPPVPPAEPIVEAEEITAVAEELPIDSLSAKKSKAAGNGGVMGKLFKRGSREQRPVDSTEPTVHNPVIEIAAPSKRVDEVSPPEVDETPVSAKPARAIEAPSRFQIIEQPPAPPPPPTEPIVEAKKVTVAAEELPVSEDVPVVVENVEEPLPESLPEVSSTTGSPVERLPEASVEKPAAPTASQPSEPVELRAVADPVEKVSEPEQVSVVAESTPEIAPERKTLTAQAEIQPAAEEVAPARTAQRIETRIEPTPIATAPTPPAQASAPVEVQPAQPKDESRLVDWTFTPPPDVTPEELRTSGSALSVKPTAVKPAAVKQTESSNKVDPEWAGPAKATRTAKASARIDGGMSQDPMTGRVTVDICVSKALKDSSGGDAQIPDKKYNSIASKEYTEVSKAYANGNAPESLREELTHLAAVCLAWADAIEKRQSSSTEVKAA